MAGRSSCAIAGGIEKACESAFLIAIHVTAGSVALIAGAVALYAAKGGSIHKKGGWFFAVSMTVMTLSALVIAIWQTENRVNVVAALITFYLVCTGTLAVWRGAPRPHSLQVILTLVAGIGSGYAVILGREALSAPTGEINGVPAPPIFMFAIVGIVGALLDARLLFGRKLQGRQRLARHLWRMTFALWIATASFFLGQAQVFPKTLSGPWLAVPVMVVLVVLLYWLIRVVLLGRLPTRVGSGSINRAPNPDHAAIDANAAGTPPGPR